MRRFTRLVVMGLFACSTGCGGVAPGLAPGLSGGSGPTGGLLGKGTSTPTDEPSTTIPTTCADASAPVCTPPPDFVDRLCEAPRQDMALALLARATPFSRGYLRGRLDELRLDEEVLILRFHAPLRGGVIVGKNLGTYDVLRWDGTCSMALEAEMIARTRPARPTTARLQWHRIGSRIQDALIAASDPVKRARAKRGRECKGAMSGDVTDGCAQADAALGAAVVDYLRSGGAIPLPDDGP